MGQPDTSSLNGSQSPLHPVLQTALGCLEVQLDDELTRYRRQRSTQPAANRPFKSQVRTKKKPGLDLISVKPASPNSASAHQPPQSIAPPYPNGTSYSNGSANGSANHGYSSNGHSHNGHSHNGHAQNGHSSNGIQASTTGAIATLDAAQPHGPGSAIAAPPPPLPISAQGNLVPVPPIESDALDSASTAEPQDYLESSEHLLQSLVEEAQTATGSPKSSWTNQLFTPLGIGSMLLLLVSSIGLGYVIANPDALSNINARWQADDGASSTGSTGLDEPVTPNSSKFDPSGQPNLSSEEFVELDLGTLSTLPSNAPAPSLPSPAPGLAADGSTTPTPLASPVTPPTSSAAGTPAPGTSPNSAAPSAPPSTAPSSSSSSAAPATSSSTASRPSASGAASGSSSSSSSASRAAAPTPPAPPRPAASTSTGQSAAASRSSDSGADTGQSSRSSSSGSSETASSSTGSDSSNRYYHVVVPYTGDQSLNEARQVAGDAYIHNSSSGATIRLGAFADQSSAQEMVQNLQEQGLEADIED